MSNSIPYLNIIGPHTRWVATGNFITVLNIAGWGLTGLLVVISSSGGKLTGSLWALSATSSFAWALVTEVGVAIGVSFRI